MNEQLPLDSQPKPHKRLILRFILLVLFIFATAYLLKSYNIVSYFNKAAANPAPAPVTTAAPAPAEATPLATAAQVKEAVFLARIATDMLQKDHYLGTAKDLLIMAQNRLNGLQGEKIDNARYILNVDIVKLSTAQAMDTKELQEKLATLDKLIAVLPLKHATNVVTTDTDSASAAPQAANAQDNKWLDMLSDAKSVVKVRKKSANPTAYSADVALDVKRAQFKLLIEQVRWALFYNEATVYHDSLAKAQELLPEIFDIHSESVQKFAMTLHELSQVNLNSAIPDIHDSVNALEAIG